jgi:membrane-bound lytic murein transglycosylase B
MLMRGALALATVGVVCVGLSVTAAIAAECPQGSFANWLDHFKQKATRSLASTANYLKSYGWTAGKPWTEGAANFVVLQKWKESEVYAKTVVANRLAKEP